MKPACNHNRILVVDGSLIVLDRIKLLLKELEGVEKIETASDYATAVEILAERQQDVVLLEISLNDKSGFELLAHIRQHFPDTKTIILSNLSDEFYRNKCRLMGADYFIDKSGEFDKIARIIMDDHSFEYQLH